LDLSDYRISDSDWYHVYQVPTGTVLPAGSHQVFADNLLKFNVLHPNVPNVNGPLGFELSNKSDAIRLYDRWGELLQSVTYQDKSPWPKTPDGDGYTLENKNFEANIADPTNWQAGCLYGSPGMPFDPDCTTSGVMAASESSIMIWPNPSTEIFYGTLPFSAATQLFLYDICGRIVDEKTVQFPDFQWNISHLPVGVYFLKAQSDFQQASTKLIIR
jgi:hypothetical protein